MKRAKKAGRPAKKTSGGASVKTYRNKRRYLGKLNKNILAHGGATVKTPRIPEVITTGSISLMIRVVDKAITLKKYYTARDELSTILTSIGLEEELPEIPKTITKASVRKLKNYTQYYTAREDLIDVLTSLGLEDKIPDIPKNITKGSVARLNKLLDKYSQYLDYNVEEPPIADPEPEPPFEDEIIETYRDFISMAYDSAFAESKFHDLNGSQMSFTGVHDIIIEHANNCMSMLERIGAFDNEHKKQVAKALMAKASEIYDKTERYLYYYTCLFDDSYGITVLQEVEEALTTQVGETFTEAQRKDYAKVLSDYGDYFEEYYGEE